MTRLAFIILCALTFGLILEGASVLEARYTVEAV